MTQNSTSNSFVYLEHKQEEKLLNENFLQQSNFCFFSLFLSLVDVAVIFLIFSAKGMDINKRVI